MEEEIKELKERIARLEDAILHLGHWETNWRGERFVSDVEPKKEDD